MSFVVGAVVGVVGGAVIGALLARRIAARGSRPRPAASPPPPWEQAGVPSATAEHPVPATRVPAWPDVPHRSAEVRPAGEPEGRDSLWRGVTFVIATVALVMAAVALSRSNDRTQPATSGSSTATIPAATTSATTAPASSTPPTTAITTVTVPDVVGMSRADAISTLAHAGLGADEESLNLGNVQPGYVVAQAPPPESVLAPGAKVSITVSAGA